LQKIRAAIAQRVASLLLAHCSLLRRANCILALSFVLKIQMLSLKLFAYLNDRNIVVSSCQLERYIRKKQLENQKGDLWVGMVKIVRFWEKKSTFF
jgi:hypothetical protein